LTVTSGLPALTLLKTVVNDNGGTALDTAWTLNATQGATTISGVEGDAAITNAAVATGTWTLGENGGPAGYTASSYSCVKNTGSPVVGDSITLATGDTATCTITNDDAAPSLTLVKSVTNNNGGTALASAWTLTATGTLGSPTNLSGTTPVTSGTGFKADTYTLAETGGPVGYTASSYSCVKNSGSPVVGDSITLALGDTATCTITNNDQVPSLTLVKSVTNDNGGTAAATDWTLTATGTLGSPTNLSGTSPVTSGSGFKADTYTLAESGGPTGYTASSYSCVKNSASPVLGDSITLALGDTATCTITNNDNAPSLTLVKTVTNGYGGTAVVTDWTLTATGSLSSPTNLNGTTPVSSGVGFKADTYTLTESGGPAGYTAATWSCTNSVIVTAGQITLGPGESTSCTLHNSQDPTGINAVNDDFSGSPINGFTGGTTTTVFINDTLDGASFLPAAVSASITDAGGIGVTINSDGTLNVPAGTAAGSYSVTYQICDAANLSNCDTATVSLAVSAAVIDAVDDSAGPINGLTGATNVLNVFDNDTLDGSLLDPAKVNLTFVSGDAELTLISDGSVNVSAGTAAGSYAFIYQICEKLNSTNCDTATVTVTVSAAAILAVNDDFSAAAINGTTGGTTVTVYTNDTLNGAAFLPAAVTSSITSDGGLTGVTINSNGTLNIPVSVAGNFTVTYEICEGLNPTNCDRADVSITVYIPYIGIAKTMVGSPVEVSTGTWDVTFAFHVENYGNSALTGLRVTDDLAGTFLTGTTSTTFSVRSLTSPEFSVNPLTGPGAFTGFGTGIDLLTGDDTLAVGGSGTILLVVRVVPDRGSYFDTAFAYGNPPSGPSVSDESTDGTDPDSTTPCTGPCSLNGDGNPTNNTKATEITFAARLFDPPFGQKTVNAAGLPELIWTMVWINGSNIVEVNAAVSDEIPLGTTYVAGSLVCSPASGLTITDTCLFEAASLTYPRGRILWTGQIGPDLGATDATSAANELVITFRVTVSAGINSVQNEAVIDSDLNGNGLTTDPGEQRVAVADAIWPTSTPTLLPSTGFAPNRVTSLPAQTTSYEALGDLWLEIPRLGVKMPIVGVPQGSGSWDVSWLGSNAGWLNGTAFPTHAGNSVLTGHVFDAFGTAGPFVHLNWLWYGDKVIVHAWGADYTYEVRQVKQMAPGAVSSVLKHEELPWVTLVTCRGYDEVSDTYLYRVVVRAVLVDEK
jgi:LPXTG-site transpeptidase (sortase) family protein